MTPTASSPNPLETLAALCAEGVPVPDEAIFPAAAMQTLRDAGILRAVLPSSFGGCGFGTEPGKGPATLALFYRLCRLCLPLGRLVEAHVNALRIVARYGTPMQMQAVAEAVLGGDLFGLWVTDPPSKGGLVMRAEGASLRLSGGKMFCSGAGVVRWAVATAFDPACRDQRLLLLQLDGSERIGPLPSGLAGMKAAVTGQVDVSGRRIPQDSIIGAPGDYLKEPDFSGGAWRSSAVALGGLYRLVELMREQLIVRHRDGDPHQRSRFGQLVTAHETGRLWLTRAGAMAEDLAAPATEIVATVGLARLAVERACLDGIEIVHRSLGLSAFLDCNPVERLTRDLQTYLRQPAPDEVLHNAAGFFLAHKPLSV
jgi:alkylation response protein AidB-like acyl-CoA dehydrogenase